MRRSLLPGLVEVLKRNLSRGFKNLAIFEAGHVFIPGEQLGSSLFRRWVLALRMRFWLI